MDNKPIDQAYVFLNANIICGEYPGCKEPEKTRRRLPLFTDFGITDFIDLTEEGELTPYAGDLPAGVRHHRFPIEDVRNPECCEDVIPVMQTIDGILDRGGKVYIHCMGGIGRTGLIAACYACWHKRIDGNEALQLVAESFKDNPKSLSRSSPETEEQREFVCKFADFLKQKQGECMLEDIWELPKKISDFEEKKGLKFPRGRNNVFTDKLSEFVCCVKTQECKGVKPGDRGDLSCYFEVLTHLQMKSGTRLEYQQVGCDEGSAPEISGLDNIIIDRSPEGAWEAVLLHELGGQFNLVWHAGDLQICIVTNWRHFYLGKPADEVSGREVCDIADMKTLLTWDITPRVEISGNEAAAYYCVFHAWSGFYQVRRKVHFDTGVVDEPEILAESPYCCMVIF